MYSKRYDNSDIINARLKQLRRKKRKVKQGNFEKYAANVMIFLMIAGVFSVIFGGYLFMLSVWAMR